ncbi:MAG TPA: nitrate ABC transporter substrate-binding protein [Acetobacteraceae bacterium]|jgi:NitT/TauT family transport system substrate-binding protein|nr:nitrate ABC transporter substrate-binding protein [Acetobacteraceae bacterium]
MAMRLMALVFAFLLGAVPCRAEIDTVRIPLGAGGFGFLPLYVMQARGLIEKHAHDAGLELKADWIKVGGPTAMNDALLSGSADFIAAGPPGFLTLWSRTTTSMKIKGVAAMTAMPTYLTTRQARLQTLEDFREGDKIAVTAPRVSIVAICMQMYARQKYGAAETYRFEPFLLPMSHADATIAMLSGSTAITADWSSPPFYEREMKNLAIHTITDTDKLLGGPVTFTMLSTTSKFRAENPKAYAAVLAALKDAVALIRSDKVAAAKIFLEKEPGGFSEEEIVSVLNEPQTQFGTAPQGVMRYANFMFEAGLMKVRPTSWKDVFFPEIHDLEGN